jgi:spermidine/putrescine transport system permease protein
MVEERYFLSKIMHPLLVCLVYLFLYLPIVLLAVFSFNDSQFPVEWTGFSLRWYKALWYNPEVLDAAKNSLIIGIASTVMSVTFGIAFVFASKWWRSQWWFNIFYANILLPDIVLAIGILSLFSFFAIPVGYVSLISGHTLIGLGFVIPILRARFSALDPVLTEASLDLGATHFQTFFKVILPLMKPALVASMLLVFTLSLDDFLIAFFCSGSSVQTLSVYVYSKARTGIDPSINALSAIFLMVSSVIVLLLCFLKVAEQVISHE